MATKPQPPTTTNSSISYKRVMVQLPLQVIDLTDALLQPPRVRHRAAHESSQDAVEIVGVQGGAAIQQGVRANQAGGSGGVRQHGASTHGVHLMGPVRGMAIPAVPFPPQVAPASAQIQAKTPVAAAQSPAKSPQEDPSEAKCALCLDALKEDLCINPSCGHVFHFSCMKASLQKYKYCPRCRKKIPSEKSLKRIYM